MSDPASEPDPKVDAERRRRRAAVFGETTSDEEAEPAGTAGSADSAGSSDTADEWLRSQVPPHHG